MARARGNAWSEMLAGAVVGTGRAGDRRPGDGGRIETVLGRALELARVDGRQGGRAAGARRARRAGPPARRRGGARARAARGAPAVHRDRRRRPRRAARKRRLSRAVALKRKRSPAACSRHGRGSALDDVRATMRGARRSGGRRPLALTAGPAGAAVPFKEIGSAGPLTSVVDRQRAQLPGRPCRRLGTRAVPVVGQARGLRHAVAVGDTLFAPDFANHDGSATGLAGTTTPFSPVSQTRGQRAGHSGQPAAGHDGRHRRRDGPDRHREGLLRERAGVLPHRRHDPEHRRRRAVGDPVPGRRLLPAGVRHRVRLRGRPPARRSAARSTRTTRRPRGSSSGSRSRAATSSWRPTTARSGRRIAARQPLPNTSRSGESIDNGAGISWSFSVAPGASATYSHYTTFSPRGIAGPPAPAPATPAVRVPSSAFGSRGLLETPSNRRCVSRRYFRIKLRKRYWPVIAAVTVRMPKRQPRPAPPAVGHDRRPARPAEGALRRADHGADHHLADDQGHAHLSHLQRQAARRPAEALSALVQVLVGRQREELDEAPRPARPARTAARDCARAALALEPLVVADLAADALELLVLESRGRARGVTGAALVESCARGGSTATPASARSRPSRRPPSGRRSRPRRCRAATTRCTGCRR